MIDTNDVLSEILNVDFNVTNKDTKVSYNKVLAKADIEIRIIYLTEDRKNKNIRRNHASYRVHRFSRSFRRQYM